MAVNSGNLVPVASGYGGDSITKTRVYDYSTSDDIADVEELDGVEFLMRVYFSTVECIKIFRPNDLIRVTANDGNGLYAVASVAFSISSPTIQIIKIASVTSFS